MTMTDITNFRGRKVADATGDRIGSIGDIHLDEQTGQPEWLAVRTGLFGRGVEAVPRTQWRTGSRMKIPVLGDL